MAKMKISKYIFSFLILLTCLGLKAQKQEWNGLTLNADLSRLVLPYIDTTRHGWEFSGDYELRNDLFLVTEFGTETTKLNKTLYNYYSSGGYTRLGIDYNFMRHADVTSHDKMFLGLRYGFTTYYHQADHIIVADDSWGNYTGSHVDKKWLTGHWAEAALGMRTQLFGNFYLGWSVRLCVLLHVQNDPVMVPYSIPGFGKAWNNTSIGFNYSLSYKIPIYKRKIVAIKKETKKKK